MSKISFKNRRILYLLTYLLTYLFIYGTSQAGFDYDVISVGRLPTTDGQTELTALASRRKKYARTDVTAGGNYDGRRCRHALTSPQQAERLLKKSVSHRHCVLHAANFMIASL